MQAEGIGLVALAIALGVLGWFWYSVGTMCITSAPTDCSETPLSPLAVQGLITMFLSVAVFLGGFVELLIGGQGREARATRSNQRKTAP